VVGKLASKAIIIAAGMGRRMESLTQDKPKCLLPLNGKPLINIQIDCLRSNGIKDIFVVKGYQANKLKIAGLQYFMNPDYEDNNILESLFYAQEEMHGDIIILYCDIIFETSVVEELLASKEDISIVVDENWKANYIGRKLHPISEAESVFFDEKGYVVEIGKNVRTLNKENAPGEFIGMLKLTENGSELFKKYYEQSKKTYSGQPFQQAPNFKKAYLTDLFQEMVDNSIAIHCVKIKNGWKELDTQEDFYNAEKSFNDMIL
jgi:L-glutamine-phosphate cytidylyltransferase